MHTHTHTHTHTITVQGTDTYQVSIYSNSSVVTSILSLTELLAEMILGKNKHWKEALWMKKNPVETPNKGHIGRHILPLHKNSLPCECHDYFITIFFSKIHEYGEYKKWFCYARMSHCAMLARLRCLSAGVKAETGFRHMPQLQFPAHNTTQHNTKS